MKKINEEVSVIQVSITYRIIYIYNYFHIIYILEIN